MQAVFLDRDGVINKEKSNGYILNPSEFEFYDGACEAVAQLSHVFDYCFIVTNQRGVGRGLMTTKQLQAIHERLKYSVEKKGGKIDAIYFEPNIDDNHPRRKPNTGMALDAKRDFPDLDFEQSVMVGNSFTDMQFGKAMNMKTVFICSTQAALNLPHPLIDRQFPSLASWVNAGCIV